MDSSKVSKMVAEEYSSSLSDLTINSKPLINMLTMLAEENREHAPAIVEAVEKHLQKVQSDIKLPVLYLIDSIVKNVGKGYVGLFTQNIVSTFCACFEKVDERTRAQMFKLRQTWNDVFPAKKLYAVDVRVSSIDPAWPITAPPPTSIHVNPKFFAVPSPTPVAPAAPSQAMSPMAAAVANLGMLAALDADPKTAAEKKMRDELIRKQKELFELHQKKLTLEMMQTKAKLEEQQKQLEQQTGIARVTQQLMAAAAPSMQSSTDAAQLLAVQKFLEAATLNIAGVVAPVSTIPSAVAQQQKAVTVAANSSAKAPAKTPALPASPSKSVARTRDPRLAGRPAPQVLTVVPPQETETFFDAVKLVEPAKPKPHITINLGCDNKSNVPNKEPRGITKPRNISNKGSSVGSKAFPTSNSECRGNGAKTKIPTPSVSNLSTMKRIPKLKDKDSPKIINIDLTLASSPLNPTDDLRNSKENIVLKKSPNKVEKPKGKSSQPEKDKSPNKKPIEKQKSKPDSPRTKKPDKKVGDAKREKTLAKSKEDSRLRSKYDMVESEEDSPSPPPPPNISSTKKQEGRPRFRDVKISTKGRNYIPQRRGESRSRSPPISDVDLRLTGPPEKQQKLMPAMDTVKKPVIDAHLVSLDAGKDVDLRQTPGSSSPGKKRLSSDREVGDQPPNKKSKAEMFDILFGNEDVDLRRLAGKSSKQPSPPPPPIISGQPLTVKICDSDDRQQSSPPKPDSKKSVGKGKAPEIKGNGDLNPRDWSKFKGPKSPVVSSYRDRYGKKPGPAGKLDRLGRPHLFGRSSDDEPRDKRRRSGDTDMRSHADDLHEESDSNINMIMSQANEQIKSGQLSSSQYNTLLTQVVQLNETKKLREAKRRDEKWERRNSKPKSSRLDLSPVSDDGSSPTFSPGSDGSDTNHRSGASPPRKREDERYRPGQRMHRGNPRGPNGGGNRPWQRPPNPWLYGQPGLGPMHHQQQPFMMPPGGEGNYRWRQPHQQPFMPMGPGPMGVPMAGVSMGSVPMGAVPMVSGIRPIAPNLGPGPMPVTAMSGGSMPVGIPGFETDAPNNNAFDSFAQQQEEFPSQQAISSHDDMPLADPLVLDNIAKDTMRTINIDGHPREIRYYGDIALTMVNWDDPREVMFQRGTRRVMFDDRERDSITCSFNEPYRDFVIDGFQHKIRFGAPTRELWIDGKWYECYFGGPPVKVELGGKLRSVNLEGPPPQVKLGYVKRLDLCVGKINLIIDAINMVPIFLDSKPQRFDIENKPHILRFVNALTTVLINGRPFDVEFGGLPMPIVVRNKKHFIRFPGLPPGVRPGYVSVRNMEGGRLPSPPPPRTELDATNGSNEDDALGGVTNTAVPPPAFGGMNNHQPFNPDLGPANNGNAASNSSMPSQGVFFKNDRNGGQVPLDMLTSLMPTALAPSSGFDYQVDYESNSQEAIMPQPNEPSTMPSSEAGSSGGGFLPFLTKDINIQELFQKLVATGIVATDAKEAPAAIVEVKKVEEEPKIVKHVEFRRIETLRIRQPGMVAILYSGIQCSSCGVRFPPEETVKYSQHLDWHFRQNRRDRDNTRKAQSRKWYYDVSDWLQYEEIEDLDHRPQIWFDPQTEAAAGEENNEPVVIPSVPVGENSENPFCEMCHDKFEQFYNEDSEEWHLKLAVRMDGKIYHPLCYEDFKSASYEHDESADVETKDEPNVEVAEEVEIKMETDEDEVPKLENVEEIMETEIKTESEVTLPELEEISVKMEVDVSLDACEDLTTHNPEDDDSLGRTEGELVVGVLLDDVLETVELRLFGPRPVKLEPVDDKSDISEVTPIVAIVEEPKPVADTTHAAVVSSIDGNVQFEDAPMTNIAAAGSKIKINITKPLPVREVPSEVDAVVVDKAESGDVVFEGRTVGEEDNEPPPPGVEETLHPETLKPKLIGRQLVVLPPVRKGTELSGLCSIM